MKNAKFGLTLVIFSIVVTACGSSKTMKGNQTSAKNESAKTTEKKVESGAVTCDTVKDQTVKPGIPTAVMSLKVKEKAQSMIMTLCTGEQVRYSVISDLDFVIDRKNQSDADMIEVHNRTTCSSMNRSVKADQIAAQAIGAQASAPLNEFRSIRVLPLGNKQLDSYELLSLDPGRPNYLDVQFKKCQEWQPTDGAAKCAKSEVVEEQTVIVSIDFNGQHHRGHRLENQGGCIQ
ncbi:MAG: hypothetical protein AB7N80_02225 [Bdellovibrionales bacterium]